MAYSTLMVHLELGSANDGVLRAAASLARRFEAKVIGIAACQSLPMVYGDGYTAGVMMELDLPEIARETAEAEARFRATLQGQVAELEWRSVTANEPLADYVVREARTADLIVTGPDQGWSAFEATRRLVVSDMVLRAGRPVLVVPPDATDVGLESVVVGWRDTREARRAIADALPLLKRAGRVFVVEIVAANGVDAARRRLADVSAWLGSHGVASDSAAPVSTGDDAGQLGAIALDRRADLMVAGAFGHNRLREWVLGGVSRDLLLHPTRCTLVSC